VVQQSRGGLAPTRFKSSALEADARRVAEIATRSSRPVRVAEASGVGIARDQETDEERRAREKRERALVNADIKLPPELAKLLESPAPSGQPAANPAPGAAGGDTQWGTVMTPYSGIKLPPELIQLLQAPPGQLPQAGPVPAPAPAPCAPATSTTVDVRNWPTVLTTAVRDPKQEQIKKVPDKLELTNTAAGNKTALTADQQAIVDQIKANRDKVPVNPDLQEHPAFGRGADKVGGFQYTEKGGSKFHADNPYTDPKWRDKWDAVHAEIANEGSVSAINTYDDAWVTLGRGFRGALLSRAMEDFLGHDDEARNALLDIGVSFSGGKLRVVNTDNGAIEEDQLVGGVGTNNAQKIVALSKPILSEYISLAEIEAHGKKLQSAQLAQTFCFKFTKHVAESWNDLMAVRLVAHLIQWRTSLMWSAYENCDDNVKKILTVIASGINGATRNPSLGNALVTSANQTQVLFQMVNGKAKQGLDSATAEEPGEVAADSQRGMLYLQAPSDAKKYYKVTLA
jgi:hypothetical protein